jgi:hypothetical protein
VRAVFCSNYEQLALRCEVPFDVIDAITFVPERTVQHRAAECWQRSAVLGAAVRWVVPDINGVAATIPPFCTGEREQCILGRLIQVGAENGSTALIGERSRDAAVHCGLALRPCTAIERVRRALPVNPHRTLVRSKFIHLPYET